MKKQLGVRVNNGGSVPNRRGLYAKTAKYAKDAIECLVDLMKNSKNDSVRVSAAKALLDKCLPDLRAVEAIEIDKGNQQPLQVVIVEDKENNTQSL